MSGVGLQTEIKSSEDLLKSVLSGQFGGNPDQTFVTGAFWVSQTTKFPGTSHRYHNRYIVLRVENAFGGCCVELGDVDPGEVEVLSGSCIRELLTNPCRAIRVAALDAFVGHVYPIETLPAATQGSLPAGSPIERAKTRDASIASLIRVKPGQKVGLIGVVNPLVDAITERGAQCLPCDFNMKETASGLRVHSDMTPVLEQADFVIATGMTLSNGSFEEILAKCQERCVPLVIFAQTGTHVFGKLAECGCIAGLVAETFPYSQFSSSQSPLYIVDNLRLQSEECLANEPTQLESVTHD